MVLPLVHICYYLLPLVQVLMASKFEKHSFIQISFALLGMASFALHFFLVLFCALIKPSKLEHLPKALVLPISKDLSTHQYTTQVNQRTPLVPINVVVDLSSEFLWISRGSNYRSSSYKSTYCNSTQCSLAHHTKNPRCADNICTLSTFDGLSKTALVGNLSEDTLSLHSTDGLNPGPIVSTPFLFSSTWQDLTSIAGLGPGPLALPTQLASAFKFPRVFAICLPPSTTASQGVVFFGDGPYAFFPGIDVSKLLAYTPLIPTPGHNNNVEEYLIGITSIQVNGRKVQQNSSSLLAKISTVNPYTTMESSIYKSFTRVFARAARKGNLTRADSRPPFELCYNTRTSGGYRSAMPTIDLVLQSDEVFWRVFETNSMVLVDDQVACLGFLDAGFGLDSISKGASISIGGRQLEDNLLQFDLELSRLGFTSTLLFRQTSCAYFNFTPKL